MLQDTAVFSKAVLIPNPSSEIFVPHGDLGASSWWSVNDQPRSRCRKVCYHLLPLVLLIPVWSLVDKSKSHQHRGVSASSNGTHGLKDWRDTLEPRLGQNKWRVGSFAACSTPACFSSNSWFTALCSKWKHHSGDTSEMNGVGRD